MNKIEKVALKIAHRVEKTYKKLNHEYGDRKDLFNKVIYPCVFQYSYEEILKFEVLND